MVVHVVLFRPKADVAESARDDFLEALRVAAREIPTVRRFQIGARVVHGAAYEGLATKDFTYAAIVEFDDVSGLQTYLKHPKHERVGTLFYELLEAALVYDYQTERL